MPLSRHYDSKHTRELPLYQRQTPSRRYFFSTINAVSRLYSCSPLKAASLIHTRRSEPSSARLLSPCFYFPQTEGLASIQRLRRGLCPYFPLCVARAFFSYFCLFFFEPPYLLEPPMVQSGDFPTSTACHLSKQRIGVRFFA